MKLETLEDLEERIIKHFSNAELGFPQANSIRKSPGEVFSSYASDPGRSGDLLALSAWRREARRAGREAPSLGYDRSLVVGKE